MILDHPRTLTYSDPFGLCPIEKDGVPCSVAWGAAGTAIGGVGGAVIGGTGGTIVAPVVGTITGAAAVGGAGALLGGFLGSTLGAARDAVSALQALLNRRGDLPAKGKPNSSAARDDGKGNGQIRDYGPDGRAETDYDFGHDHGKGDPHAHDWDWSKTPPRQPGRPIRPDEKPPR